MKKQQSKKSTVKAPGESFKPALTLSEITDDFVKKQNQKSKDTGANSVIADFSTVARMVIANMKSFSIQDILALTRSLDTQVSALVPLIHLWIAELKSHNRIKLQMSCYDAEHYILQ